MSFQVGIGSIGLGFFVNFGYIIHCFLVFLLTGKYRLGIR